MSVDMTKNLTYAFCTSDGGSAIAVQKRERSAESFNDGLEAEYRSRIDREAWGDNNTRGDNKVDIKVDNNARGDNKVDIKVDNKVDNNVWNDTVNDTVKHPQPRTRTTTPYNTRTSSVQHPHKKRRCRLGRVMGRIGFSYGPLSGLKSGPLNDVVTNLIAEISSVNRKDLVRRTGVSERTMTRSLSELERSGKIERRGSKKTGGYYLAEGSGGSGKAI